MPVMEIPRGIEEKLKLVGNSLESNGFVGDPQRTILINDVPVSLSRVKGGFRDGTFCIFYDSELKEWYKAAGSKKMNKGVNQEIGGMTSSLRANGLDELASQVRSVGLMDGFISVSAAKSPHLGETIEGLYRRDKSLSEFLFSAYEVAYLHAVELLNNYNVWAGDPNPGNIILRRGSNNSLNVILIDFTGTRYKATPNSKNENILRYRFEKSAEKLVTHGRRFQLDNLLK